MIRLRVVAGGALTGHRRHQNLQRHRLVERQRGRLEAADRDRLLLALGDLGDRGRLRDLVGPGSDRELDRDVVLGEVAAVGGGDQERHPVHLDRIHRPRLQGHQLAVALLGHHRVQAQAVQAVSGGAGLPALQHRSHAGRGQHLRVGLVEEHRRRYLDVDVVVVQESASPARSRSRCR